MAAVARPLILIVLLMSIVEGRILRLNSSDDELISDGMDGGEASLSATESCNHQYDFLPCAENAAGYLFNVVVYQVLLIVGDKMIGSGSEVLFYITGAKFGGILFRILRALPSMMLMILSGIYSTKMDAQSQVSVVVGIYAGTIVFALTLQWFMCMVSASTSLKEDSNKQTEALASNTSPIKEKLRILIEHGVEVDEDTCKTAGIMLLSLIPYLVLQLVYVFHTPLGKRVMTLVALVVSSLSLVLYFAYQIKDPWMQKRSLNYSKFDSIQRRFVQYLAQLGKLVKDDGTLDEDLIKGLFRDADQDESGCIADKELEKLVNQVFKAGTGTHTNQNDLAKQVICKFDRNSDNKIGEAEFLQGFKKWIQDAKHSASDSDINLKEMFDRVSRLLQENKQNNAPDIDKIMSKILKKAEGHLLKSEELITDNGEPNEERIKRLFRDFDTNNDGSLTENELRKLICRVKFETYQMKDDDVMREMFRNFDENDDKGIDQDEFINGVKRYLEKATKSVNTSEKTRILTEFDETVWKEVEYGRKDFFKSVLQVLLGIAMLTFLAKPLMSNILYLSHAMNFPSFIISFVAVPLAMNARAAIAALLPASKKRIDTASLTFSEIYGGVIMINITGLTTLLAIVYAKQLVWDFSAEVLTILVVCGIIGLHAFLSTTYHLWTCIPAFLLYPISLGLFYFVQAVFHWN